MDAWLFTVVYANPNATMKKQCFDGIAQLAGSIRRPWMVIGDFNEILLTTEKVGGAAADSNRISRFGRWVQKCQLIDLGSKGPRFTWRGGVRNGYYRCMNAWTGVLGILSGDKCIRMQMF